MMAYDHLSEYFRAKNTIVQAANTSLAQWKTPYNFSIDDIVDEFFGTLYDWNNTSSVVLILLYVPTFLIALLGNILVILTVTGKKTLRQVRNYFLVNLAIADLTITLLCMPTSVGSIVYRLWIYGEFLCKATTFLQGVAVAASIFTLMAMSIDRFIGIKFPMSKRRVTKPGEALGIILSIWLISALIMIPLILVRELDVVTLEHFGEIKFCREQWRTRDNRRAFGVASLLLVYIIPSTILAVCYACIGKTLYDRKLERVNSNSSVQTVESRQRAARMLVVLVLLFLLFWLPYNIISLTMDISGSFPQIGVLLYSLWLGHAHSAINPIMYWCLNVRLREGFRGLTVSCSGRGSSIERKPTPPPYRAPNRRVRKMPNVVVIHATPRGQRHYV